MKGFFKGLLVLLLVVAGVGAIGYAGLKITADVKGYDTAIDYAEHLKDNVLDFFKGKKDKTVEDEIVDDTLTEDNATEDDGNDFDDVVTEEDIDMKKDNPDVVGG